MPYDIPVDLDRTYPTIPNMGSLMFPSSGPGPSPVQSLLSGLHLQCTGGVDTHTDVILHAREGTRIKVHKAVLWAMSPYMKNVLLDLVPRACIGCPGATTWEPEIFLPDVRQAMLSKVIQFIYTGTVVGTDAEKEELQDILTNVFGIGPSLATEESTPPPGQQRIDCPISECTEEAILPCNAWAHFRHHLAAETSGHQEEVDANMSIKCIICRTVINYIDKTPELSREKFKQHYMDHSDSLKLFVYNQSGGHKVDASVDELLRQAQQQEETEELNLLIEDVRSGAVDTVNGERIPPEAAVVTAAAVDLPDASEGEEEEPSRKRKDSASSSTSYSGGVTSTGESEDEDESMDISGTGVVVPSSTAPPPAKRSKDEPSIIKRKCGRCSASVAQTAMQRHLVTHYYDKFTEEVTAAYKADKKEYHCHLCSQISQTKNFFVNHLAAKHDMLTVKLGGLEVEDLFDPVEEPPLLSKADFNMADGSEVDKGAKQEDQ